MNFSKLPTKEIKRGIILSFSLFAMFSCKKQYECVCEEYINGVQTNLNTKSIIFEEKDLAQAEWYCKQFETLHYYNGDQIGFQCIVKQQ